jgi:hypothetical protein
MTTPSVLSESQESMILLSRLLLDPRGVGRSIPPQSGGKNSEGRNNNRETFQNLVTLANSNHVVVRGLEVFLSVTREGKDDARSEWAQIALSSERARIALALRWLNDICAAFKGEGHNLTVIKSLDHWPDLGSDLDLYTDSRSEDISELMSRRFGAQVARQSWGDRLAGKWNFAIPGLPEAVEIHVGRLGQTGEQVEVASRLLERTQLVSIGNYVFRVLSASDRLMIATLQRMYRHFYFRLCDIADTAELSEAGGIDYDDLRISASSAGIWEGVATYLAIVSDYAEKYRGFGIELPQFVIESARFGGDVVFCGRDFLRVPIMPQSVELYGSQFAGLLRKRKLQSCARLSLLPCLATAAVIGQAITGSDKGIW